MRKLFRLLPLIAFFLFPAACGRTEGRVQATFLNLGKADAIILQTANSAVLIDAGTNPDGKTVRKALKAAGVEALDLLIITHYDKDHVGGADAVLKAIPVKRVLNPAYDKDGKQYEQYVEALEAAGVVPEALRENIAFDLDGLRYEVDVANAESYGEDEENDFSLVVRVSAEGCAFLFAGDAENPRLAELIGEGNLTADVLKVPHHGRFEKLSLSFFEAVGAKWGVITSSEEEPEDELTLEALRQAGTEPLLTREGTVVITWDGSRIEAEQRQP